MPRPRLARANKPVSRGGHIERVVAPSAGRKYSPIPKKLEPRTDYNPETHGQCSHCGDIVRKRKDGTLYTHRTYCIGTPLYYNEADRRKMENDKIRQWARDKGLAVTARGRIAPSIVLAYEKAHNGS